MDMVWAVFSIYVSFYLILGPHLKIGNKHGLE